MFVFKGFKLWSSSGLRTLSKSKAVGGKYCIVLPGERHEFQLSTKDTLISRFYKRVISAAFYLTLFTCKIICFLMWRSTSLYNSRVFSLQLRLLTLAYSLFSLNEIPSSGFDIALSHSCRSHRLRASSPYQVKSGTNVHNSSKYTAVIHAQLFQSPFNNSKSIIPCRWYCQCSLEYFHLYKTHLRLATLLCREKMYPLLVPSRICQTRHLEQK